MQQFSRVLKSLVNFLNRVLRGSRTFFTARRLIVGVSLLSMMFLSCICGAAFIYFNVGPATSLTNAFMGFEAWIRHASPEPAVSKGDSRTRPGITVDHPTKSFDGFTLYTSTRGTTATLVDMRGNRVHQWSQPFSKVWPHPAHVKFKVADDAVQWFRCRLFPNGDLLALYQADHDTPHGYGLAKLDKDSTVLWKCSDNFHHDFDIGDDGRIYSLTHHIEAEPVKGLASIVPPYLADSVVIVSPEGQVLESISIIEALQNSPFALMLASVQPEGLQLTHEPLNKKKWISKMLTAKVDRESGDALHANSIRVLNRTMASHFPLFKEGQVLLSLCNLNAIAVLDIPSRSIVWAAEGVWRMQHDAEFLENGHLLLYDNLGEESNSRVIEFDPNNHGYPWAYSNENSNRFSAVHRGMKQHVPNGNVLIVDPDGGRIFEVTPSKSLAWEFICPAEGDVPTAHAVVTCATRYSGSELKFLDGVPARPKHD